MERNKRRNRPDTRTMVITTKEQIDRMVKFMEEPKNFGFALNLIADNTKKQSLWNELVEILNNLGPPVRNLYKWRKVWNDLKSRSRNKFFAKQEYLSNPDTAKFIRLTSLDERVIQVIGLNKNAEEIVVKYDLHKQYEDEAEESNFNSNSIAIKAEFEEYLIHDKYNDWVNENNEEVEDISLEEALDILGSSDDDNSDFDVNSDADNQEVESFLNSPDNRNITDSLFNHLDEETQFNCNNNISKRINAFSGEHIKYENNIEPKKRKIESDNIDKFTSTSNANDQPTFNLIISTPKTINSKSKLSNPFSLTNNKNANSSNPSAASKKNPTIPNATKSKLSNNSKQDSTKHFKSNDIIQNKILSALNETNLNLKLFNKNLEKLLILKKYDITQKNELKLRKLDLYSKELEIRNKASDIELAKIIFDKNINNFK